jgi:DNA-binding transcriptional MerR regulator
MMRAPFVRRAHNFGFALDAVRELLPLSDDSAQSCEAIDGTARVRLIETDRQIADLKALRCELARVLGLCGRPNRRTITTPDSTHDW